jgi:hypothetical protein
VEKVKLTKREEAFLVRVLKILLSGERSCTHASTPNGFLHLLEDGPQHPAVERLLGEFRRRELNDLALHSYLDRFERDTGMLIRDTGALEYASRVATRFPLSSEAAERFVLCVAKAGWYGRLEGFARELCKRSPTPQEVILLFDEYTSSATYSTETDQALTRYAQSYLPESDADTQIARLEARNKEYRESID